MRNEMLIAMTMLGATGAVAEAKPKPEKEATSTKPRLFLDEHELGPGKVTAAAVAEAHQKDLASQAKHGVHYHAYWVDEKQGKIYCLVEAPSAAAATAVHREAHGLLADQVREVTGDNVDWTPAPGRKLFLDRHHLGQGKVTRPGRRDGAPKGSRRAGQAPHALSQLLVRRGHGDGELPGRGADRRRRHRGAQGGARSPARHD